MTAFVALLCIGMAACETDSLLDGEPTQGGGGPGPAVTVRTLKIAPSVSAIGDLVVDVARRRVYVSNKATNTVDVVTWSGSTLVRSGSVLVGSLPWGMTLDRTGDTLIVANSGGTSLSYVNVTALSETHRYETPNAVLYQLTPDEEDSTTELTHIDFSDRPQHIAQDRHGFVLYSTQPTQAAPDGSIRFVEQDVAWSGREANLMLWTQVVGGGNSWGPGAPPLPCWDEELKNVTKKSCVIAFVDSVKIFFESPFIGTQLTVYDHVQGFPGQVIAHTSGNWFDLVTNMQALGSDIFMHLGAWKMDQWLTGDTTFVAASGNGAAINIAEGARNPGRVWMWNALSPHPPLANRLISDIVNIADYANNTSEQTTGVSLNDDGLLLATRSEGSVFFFTNPLRLRGTFTDPTIVGGRGIAVHPAATFGSGDPTTNWAAVGGAGEIVLVDTRHFRRVGSIAIGQASAGPLRVVARIADDPADVVAHVFGVTATGSIFELAVRTSHINP